MVPSVVFSDNTQRNGFVPYFTVIVFLSNFRLGSVCSMRNPAL